MTLPVNPLLLDVEGPPISEAMSWAGGNQGNELHQPIPGRAELSSLARSSGACGETGERGRDKPL
jgi:hypothetical protein